jgi:hypothetical protein
MDGSGAESVQSNWERIVIIRSQARFEVGARVLRRVSRTSHEVMDCLRQYNEQANKLSS